MTPDTESRTATLSIAADADIRHSTDHFMPFGDFLAADAGAEIIGVDDMGMYQYLRVGNDISRRNADTWTCGRWECPAHMWDRVKEARLGIARKYA